MGTCRRSSMWMRLPWSLVLSSWCSVRSWSMVRSWSAVPGPRTRTKDPGPGTDEGRRTKDQGPRTKDARYAMPLDIRILIGAMFGVMGTLLTGYGVLGDHSIYERSLGLYINLMLGSVVLVV